ncbi:uncharacterized protein FOMMEDRAFT_158924 [Fomitiporia mediterranea MF3/22]|uniref:uncharacterized protein n=1 Tax=Fomitiporia mediterranea (strain MF3/22) TaxID=694068 RepID=UPI0004409534|nr:uncharacterized protein FOMMEDRAFT_158924 [Fomitiporia mediterranea MF3/22]EJD01763.1 hypothetical protein FOMMEDRAFT_158924 [Fomitiporia mediterranea MF3/22]
MSSGRYERLPTEPESRPSSIDLANEEASIGRRRSPPANRVTYARDPRFELPTPPAWQRVALVLFVVFLFWMLYKLRASALEAGVPAVLW